MAAVVMVATLTAAGATTQPSQLKLVNYFPSRYAQGLFWHPWHPQQVDADFGVIAGALHANTVRVFVPTRQFGWPAPLDPVYTAELSQLVGLAAAHGLRVYLSLFNYYVPYLDIIGSERWAADLLAPYKGDPRIAAVEVQNQINPTDGRAIAWARTMIPYVQQIGGGIPVSISVCGCDATADLALLHTELAGTQPDLYNFEYYPDPDANPSPTQAEGTSEMTIQSVFAGAAATVAPVRLIIGETGMSTFYPDTIDSPAAMSNPQWEQIQAVLYGRLEKAAAAVGLPPVGPWDYVDAAYGSGVTDASQRFFGLFRMDGSPKPAVAVVSQAFAAA